MNHRHESRLLKQMAFLFVQKAAFMLQFTLFSNSHFSHRVLGRLHDDFP